MIVAGLDKAGGLDYLVEQAHANPGAFMTLVGKILPTQVVGEGGGPVLIVTGVPRFSDSDESATAGGAAAEKPPAPRIH